MSFKEFVNRYFSDLQNSRNILESVGMETYWEDGDKKVTIKDVVKYLDSINAPVKEVDTKKIKPILIKQDYAGKNKERVQKSNLDYPIIVIISKGKYKSILDGNHRAYKAISNNIEKIKLRELNLDKKETPKIYKDLFDYVIEGNYSGKQNSHANRGIVFLKKGDIDVGCCIGVAHGKNIKLSEDLIERINNIKNLKFYAEGSAAKNPKDEPGMVTFLDKEFPDAKLEKKSWDDLTEEQDRGTANPKYNIIFTFMQHRYNKVIDWYPYTDGTMLEALAKPNIKYPKNSPSNFKERLEWLTNHMKKAGFYDKLNQPYSRSKLLKIMDEMEHSVYPPKQQFPDTSTYFGKFAEKIENERNQTIYDLMKQGGCCFAGSGHLIELKHQFPNLEIIDEDNI